MSPEKEAYELVLGFFKGDQKKTGYWFKTFNPILGGTPQVFIDRGRGDRLLEWIKDQLESNKPPEEAK